MVLRGHTATSQEHDGNTQFHQRAKHRFCGLCIQIAQDTTHSALLQFGKVAGQMHCCNIVGGTDQSRRQIRLPFQSAEAGFQCLCDGSRLFRLNCPQRDRAGEAAGMGVGNVKVVFESCPTGPVRIKHRNAGGTPVDPPTKPLVPSRLALNGQNCGGIGPLGKKQNLLLKGQAEIIAGRMQKSPPFPGVIHPGQGAMVQLYDGLISVCHGVLPVAAPFSSCIPPVLLSGTEGLALLIVVLGVCDRSLEAEHGTGLHRLKLCRGYT